jgi:hypothetical protein
VAEVSLADWAGPICILACAKLPKQMTEKNIATSCFITYPPIEKYAAVSNSTVMTAVCLNQHPARPRRPDQSGQIAITHRNELIAPTKPLPFAMNLSNR